MYLEIGPKVITTSIAAVAVGSPHNYQAESKLCVTVSNVILVLRVVSSRTM